MDECINTYEIGNLENAEILCIKALEENPKSFETNFTLSLIYHTIGNNEKALEFAKKMEELSISFDDYISSYNQIGTIYGYLGNKKQEFIYLEKNLKIAKKIGNRDIIGVSLDNIGNYYYNMQNLHKAKKFYLESLNYKTDKLSIAITYNSLAILYNHLHDKKSIAYSKKALLFAKEVNNPLYYANYLLFLSTIYINNQQYNLAKPLLLQTLQISQDNQMSNTHRQALKYLNIIYKNENTHSSIQNISYIL